VEVTIYGGLNAPCDAILSFLARLDYAPVQHDPRWAHVFSNLPGEDLYIAVATESEDILGVANYTIFTGAFGAVAHANPYMGYGGCSCIPGREDEVIPALMRNVMDHVEGAGCATLSVALPPFQEQALDRYVVSLEPQYCFSNFFQYNDLHRYPLDCMNSVSRHRIMNPLRRTAALGVITRPAQTCSDVEAWLDVYDQRNAKLGVRPLPRPFLMGAWTQFASVGKAQLFLAYRQTQLLGGGFFVEGRGIVDYFSCAFTDEGMRLCANFQVVDTALKYYMGRVIHRFNWQSSPSRESGVYAFKKRWGAVEGEYAILTRAFANPDVFTSRPLEEIRAAYGHHFVLPHALWSDQGQVATGELKPRVSV
jgi:hypothetical protein